MSAWDALTRKSDLCEVEARASDAPDLPGAEGLKADCSCVIEGRARPQDGHIIRPA